MKYVFFGCLSLAYIFSLDVRAEVSQGCLERVRIAAQQLSTLDESFESLNKATFDTDSTNKNVIWVRMESGSRSYPNYFDYKVEIRNSDQKKCLVMKVELDNIDGQRP